MHHHHKGSLLKRKTEGVSKLLINCYLSIP